ncbi:MAG: ATP-binding protein [Leptolyngbyaceae cyanobacterium bins.59]|nr:ATP-binding protein [Leptolyngbyaceae cyanobacterium bins.59]
MLQYGTYLPIPMCASLLKNFLLPVPICVDTFSVAALKDCFEQQQAEQVVLVNASRQPTGVVRLSRFLPYLLPPRRSETKPPETRPGEALSQEIKHLSVVEAVTILSGDLNLGQWATHLQGGESAETHWAIVNAVGEFLGLLDAPRVLKSIATNPLSLSRFDPSLTLPEVSVADRHAIRVDRSPGGTQILQILIEVLNQIPLPVMLQTSTGRLIIQNPVWQQQLSELLDPSGIQREAAAVLESLSVERMDRDRSLDPLERQRSGQASTGPAAFIGGGCEIGAEPNTCICVCPTKEGGERIWQFTKIPLPDGLMTVESLSPTAISTQPLESWLLETFKLASLDSSLLLDGGGSARAPIQVITPRTSEPLWLVMAWDITEQQQVARELTAKNADLLQLNRLKDEFLSCISHELKTPLTAILGLSSLLKEQVLGSLNERQARYVRLIHQSGRQLMAIVNDILDLTRIETGQLELVLEPVSLTTVCDAACRLALAQQAGRTDAAGEGGKKPAAATQTVIASEEAELPDEIHLEIEPGLETVIADEARLRQMLVHLLTNALKFTDAIGEVGVRVNRWEAWIAFTVWDRGIGIPADKQHLIFQKFQQLENPLTRRFEGTGLGLVLTQRLARLHGGDVTFISQEAEGSQFTLLLPPVPPHGGTYAPSQAPGQHFPSISQASNRLVLMVECFPHLIESLTEQLTRLGYHVVIARSGTEALEKARRLQPCVIFLNPVLPLLSGWDVLTLLRSDAETRQIPVIVMATAADKLQATQQRVEGFLNLPIQRRALEQLLSRLAPLRVPAIGRESAISLTIILLNLEGLTSSTPLTEMLQRYRHRVLEVDELAQAELLSRVWKPHVVVVQGTVPDPVAYLRELSHQVGLAALPLVTLDETMTQAANQVTGLSVFPCLAAIDFDPLKTGKSSGASALLQVLQVAAGVNWKPVVVAVDLALLTNEIVGPVDEGEGVNAWMAQELTDPSSSRSGHRVEWLQMLVQYLQTAGLKGIVSYSWLDVLRQLQCQCVDLVVIRLPELDLECQSCRHYLQAAIYALTLLERIEIRPPILVLNQPELSTDQSLASLVQDDIHCLQKLLVQLKTRTLPNSLSMQTLLEEIEQVLSETD